MLIDIHAHLWDRKFTENKAEILRACEYYNIDKVYISSLGCQFPDEEEIRRLNSETFKFMCEAPGTVEGYCYVNPNYSSSINELRKSIEDCKMSGLKLWTATYCDDPKVFPLIEKCIDYNIPILVHTFFNAVNKLDCESGGINVANLAKRYPEAKILMAHLGANCHQEIKPIVGFKNVSVDISGTIFRNGDIDYVKNLLGAERILFGTDMPTASFLVCKGQVEEAKLTDAEKELIYYKNALKLMERS